LFTCQDNPNAGDTHVRKQNIQKAKDLRDLGIELELFAMNKAGHSFDPAAFYREAVFLDEDEDAGQFKLSVSRKFEELRRTVRKKEFKKRSLGRISFFIADEIEFAVRLYELPLLPPLSGRALITNLFQLGTTTSRRQKRILIRGSNTRPMPLSKLSPSGFVVTLAHCS
jgi:hypothetical protein